jgi:uncharacterized protein (TIGR02453 family)
MPAKAVITRDLFKFLRELQDNNNREWFLANKQRYEELVRDPFLDFIESLAPGLHRIDPDIVVDSRPAGGSMMRIYRDIRFSKDKTPYKTRVAAHFVAEAKGGGPLPGYYVSFGPGGSRTGAGIWHPESDALRKIRDAIVKDPKAWLKATSAKQLGDTALGGESLSRPPRGYARDHPLIRDLMRTDFMVGATLQERDVLSPKLKDIVVANYRKMSAMVEFLARALGH